MMGFGAVYAAAKKNVLIVVIRMHNNAVYPTSDPPEYSELPPAAGPSAPPYEQTTLLTADDKQTEPGSSPPQSAWGDPTVNQYPPVGHYGQYPPPPPSAGPYGQPMAAPYSQPPYGTPYYSRTPTMPPQQQQQQQVVVVNGGPSQPIIYNQPEQFVGQMILACCVFWCCNCLFGLVAFILAGNCNKVLLLTIHRMSNASKIFHGHVFFQSTFLTYLFITSSHFDVTRHDGRLI